jgi:hypothetical protein
VKARLRLAGKYDGRETWTHIATDATPFERRVDALRWLAMRSESVLGLAVTEHDFPDNDQSPTPAKGRDDG